MRIVNNFFKFNFLIGIIFTIFLLTSFGNNIFAAPSVKIIEPLDGTVVHPGEQVTITIGVVENFAIWRGIILIPNILNEEYSSLPVSFTITIPQEATVKIPIMIDAEDNSGNKSSELIALAVKQTAILQSLVVEPETIFVDLDWNNNIKDGSDLDYIVIIEGIYSDGVHRDIYNDPDTIFTSSDSSIVSIFTQDNYKKYKINKVGEASIVISNSGVSKTIPVVFREPTGLRPSELIPPTTTINIQPQPSASGWYNQDLTITLNAQDNEGGSGVREVDYEFFDMAKEEYVKSDTMTFTYNKEKIVTLMYWAVDNEGNHEKDHRIEIKLDKTLPTVTIAANPSILWPPNNKMVDVKITGEASDGLSGIDSLIFKVIDEYGKIQPAISQFGDTIKLEASREGKDKDGRVYTISVIAKDKAGNESTAQITVTCPHDQGK